MEVPRDGIICDMPTCCESNATVQCEDCKAAFYCSEICLREHLSSHRASCLRMDKAKWKEPKIGDAPGSTIDRGALVSIPNDLSLADGASTGMIVTDVCSICLEDPNKKAIPIATLKACKHMFCLPCVVQWQRHSTEYEEISGALPDNRAGDIEYPALAVNGAPAILQLSDFRKKRFSCPSCRAETDDLEECLLKQAEEACLQAKLYGCPFEVKEQLLREASEISSALIQVQDPELRPMLVLADALLALDRPQEAIRTAEQLINLDRVRHAAIRSHPVLAWIEHARRMHDEEQYDEVAIALKRSAQAAAQCNVPPRPPPLLRGVERMQIYGSLYLIQGLAYQKLGRWADAYKVYKRLLTVHQNSHISNSYPKDQSSGKQRDWPIVEVYKGLATCTFEAGHYDECISAANHAIDVDRSVAGIHRLKALALSELGRLHDAVNTIIMGVLYESPWDTETRRANEILYRRLRDELVSQQIMSEQFV